MRFTGPVRRMLPTLLFTPALAAALLFPTSSVGAPAREKPSPTSAPTRVKADLDRNKLFDDFEARLATLDPAGRVDAIVTLTAPATGERVAGLQRAVGHFDVSRRFSIVDGFAATLTKGQATALARRADVATVEENSVVRALNDGAQASFGVTKARTDVPSLDGDRDGSPGTHSKADLVAAVIDTGIDAAHLDLDEGKVIAFKDFVNGRTAPYDDEGHGTHVAATIAGDGDARADSLYRGVAPAAALVGLKVLAADGSGTMDAVVAAIDWAVQNKDTYGIEAINLSLGASGCSDGTDATSRAVNNASAAGLVVAAAAGNEGPGTCTVGSPGAAANALTVGAIADTSGTGFAQAYFSSRGPTADGRIKPDVSAPGVAITSAAANTTNGYATYSGTSMATPFTAGVALLMLDANATLTPAQVKDAVRTTAIDWGRGGDNKTAGSTGPDIDFGTGRLDAYAALKAAGAALTAGPATPAHKLLEGSLSATGARADYKLEVAQTTFPIAATMIMPGISAGSAMSPDFDLYLYDPAGTLVARAETVDRQETLAYRPTATGTYTLRVYSYSGGGAFFADVSAGLGVDTTAPTVLSVSPTDGGTGVSATSKVSVSFSEAMNTASAQSAFSLMKSADGTAVTGSFSWSGATMTFSPSAALAAGAEYTARVSTAAKDAAGNAVASEKVWKFTIAVVSTVTVAPSATTIYSGSLRSGDASALASDDNGYYAVDSTTSGTRVADWYGRMRGVSNALKSLRVTYQGKSSASCTQYLYVYSWTNATWVRVDARTVGTTEVGVTVTLGGTLADYVSGTSGDGDVLVRVRCLRSDAVNFFVSGDLMRVTFDK